ncbi:MAG: hypothetical protein ACRC0G_14270, partial [Fusobacteriaceae bacterium]
MNYLNVYINGEVLKFPLIKKVQSLPIVLPEVLGLEYNDIDKIMIVKDGAENAFKYSLYIKCFNENVKNKTTMKEQLSLLKFKTFGHLELVRNSIITSKFTNFSKVRY